MLTLLALALGFHAATPVRAASGGGIIWVQTINPSAVDDDPFGLAIDSSGIYLAGVANSGVGGEWRMEKRSLTDGSLIWSQTSNPSATGDQAQGIAVDGSGVYVVGFDHVLGNTQWRIEKRDLTTGALIGAFGTAGVVTENPSVNRDVANGVAVYNTGIYVVGVDRIPSPTDSEWRIEKRNLADGSLI